MTDQPRPSRRPTIARIAEQARLSVATVDRVLNARAPVAPRTAQKVFEAAEALGYYAAQLMSQRIAKHKPGFHFGVLLMGHDSLFYDRLARHIEAAARETLEANIVLHLERIRDRSAEAIAAQLLALGARSDCVALVSFEHPRITEAIEQLRTAGVLVLSLLSEHPTPRLSPYIGSDSAACGRTAGWFFSQMINEPDALVATLVGGHRFVGHEQRDSSLRSYLREHAPQLSVLAPIVNLDNPDVAEEATFELLARHPRLRGVYIIGGGADGMLRALRQAPERPPLHVITHELTSFTRQALHEGLLSLVFDTDTQATGRLLIRRMMAMARPGHEEDGAPVHVPFRVITAQNAEGLYPEV